MSLYCFDIAFDMFLLHCDSLERGDPIVILPEWSREQEERGGERSISDL